MATSGSSNFATSRDSLIAGALRIAGAIAQGETPSATQVTEASEALNMMVKALQADGLPVWAIKETNVTLTASTASYTIGDGATVDTPKPLKVYSAMLRNTDTDIDTPMTLLTRQEYNSLGNKTTEGDPISFWYNPQLTTGTLTLYPTPSTTVASSSVVRIIYQRPFEDFDASTDEPDFPQEWYEAIKFMLADRLAPEYGLSLQERQDISARAERMHQAALGFGTEEGSIRFQVNIDG